MGRIEVVAKEVQEVREKIKEDIKVEVKTNKAKVMAEVDTLKVGIYHIKNYDFVLQVILEAIAPTSDLTIVVPSSNPSAYDLP